MKGVLFYISIAFIGIIKLLPIRVLYLLSTVMYYVTYYVVRYRRKVVDKNLRESFPEKTEKEIKKIAKKFYRHLSDIFIEYIILDKVSGKKLEQRVKFTNPEAVTNMLDNNYNVVIVTAHYGNWELGCLIGKITKGNGEIIAVYKRLHNKYWDKWFLKLRSKFEAKLVEMRDIFRHLISNKNNGINSAIVLVADQLPKAADMKYFVNFLNHEGTAVFLGAERLAKNFDAAVFYADTQKVKRGYYEITFMLITAEPNKTAEHEITDMHVKLLEDIVKQKPEYWMWSHKRWKRTQQNL